MQKYKVSKDDVAFIISWLFRLFVNFIGFLGIILILYEIIAIHYSSRWSILDLHSNNISIIFTFLGVILTALSAYFYTEKPKPPEKISIYFVAPSIIISCGVAIYFFIKNGSLPTNISNGFALLAIAGALLRIHTNPIQDERLYLSGTTNSSTGAQKAAPGEE